MIRGKFIISIIITVLFTVSAVLPLKAQPGNRQQNTSGSGIIIGTVKDSKTREGIEYANVVLYRSKDSSMVNGTVTDKKGHYRFEKLTNGSYYLKVNFIGFKLFVSQTLEITPEIAVKDAGEVQLSPTSTNLEGVEISAQKEQMEFNLDKKVINVDKNAVLAGGTAIDIMQTIPSVNVDVEGTVSLRGSSNVTILIDGRPSGFTSLDQIPASMIDRVEIVTNPSARYDPEGMSGIINIVLKKKKEPGYNGMASFNIGTLDKYNGSINLNYRYNRINIFGSYDLRYFRMKGFTDNYRESWYGDTVSVLEQNTDFRRRGGFHNAKAGIDYFINDFHTLSLTGSYSNRNFITFDRFENSSFDGADMLSDYYERYNDGNTGGDGYDVALNYKKTFEQKNREWTIDAYYQRGNRGNTYLMTEQAFFTDLTPYGSESRQNSNTDNISQDAAFQTDYVHPVGKGRIETGYKWTWNNSDQDYRMDIYNPDALVWVTDDAVSNHFIYDRQIHSAYLIYSNSIRKFQYQAGIRLEEMLATADQKTIGEVYKTDRFDIFPSVHLKYQFSDAHSVMMSYSRRVNRPRTSNLNPFTDYSDPFNLSTGNPYLKPEYIDAGEAGYDFSKKGTNITTTVFYRHVGGIISRIMTIDSTGVSRSVFENLSSSDSYGLELIYAQKLFKWWKFNLNGSLFHLAYSGDNVSDEARSSTSWNAKFNSSWTPMKDFDIQFTFNYTSPVVTASGGGERFFMSGGSQGRTRENYWADLGLKKDFLKGTLGVSLRVSDIFKTIRFDMESFGDNYYSYTERRRESRVIYLGVSYKINGGIRSKNKKPIINNDDIEF